ncbi:MAG: hypothetical protein COA47_07330 [Robiginitomaculum sp.]|nr:MAG: hypothetical protein COA47_07330 [Robiginitomaculum sp.]
MRKGISNQQLTYKTVYHFDLKQIIEENNTPDYRLEITQDDLVIVRPRRKPKADKSDLLLPEWAEDKARVIAIEKGWDYYALEREWQDFAKTQESTPYNIGGAFIGFCKKKDSLR